MMVLIRFIVAQFAVSGAGRIAAAGRRLHHFGIATECGFGRRPSHQDVRRLIPLHADLLQ